MVGIVILDYNNASDTINCFESIKKYSPKGAYKIIIVENGSTATTNNTIIKFLSENRINYDLIDDHACAEGILSDTTLIISKKNDGYAEGNNKALRLFDKDDDINKIMILNNDILFIEDIISQLSMKMDTIADCAIISPLLLKQDGHTIEYCCARKDYSMPQFFFEYLFSFVDVFGIISLFEKKRRLLQKNPELLKCERIEVELPSGSCMMINKSLFREIGYFDKNTFLYFEENILFSKIKALGKRNYLIPKQKCIHLGASTSKNSSSLFLMKCQMQSTEYYLRYYRHSPFWAKYVKFMAKFTVLKFKIKDTIFSLFN